MRTAGNEKLWSVSRLELLAWEVAAEAWDLPIPPEVWLREYLRREVERRLRAEATAAPKLVVCSTCENKFELSERRERELRRIEGSLVCPDCRHPKIAAPGTREQRWVARLDTEVRQRALAAVASLNPLPDVP